jgi:hypothetical protein
VNPLLEALVRGEPAPNSAASPNTGPGKGQPVQKLHYTHEAMIDLIIACPEISNEEIALRFGYTPSWISTVVVSDIFQAKLASRREQIIDPELRTSVRAQFKGLLERSMEILRHKMNAPAKDVPDQLAVQVAKMASTSLGFGVKETKVTIQETNLHLTELGANLVGLLRQRKAEAGVPAGRIIDVQVHEGGASPQESGQPQQREQGNHVPAAGDGPR